MIWSLVSLVGLVSVFGAGVGISWSWREVSGAGTSISKACKSSGAGGVISWSWKAFGVAGSVAVS